MSKELQRMTIKDIFKEFGLPVEKDSILQSLKDVKKMKVYKNLNEVLKMGNTEQIIESVAELEDEIDKAKLVFVIGMHIEKQLEKASNILIRTKLQERNEKIKELLSGEEVFISEIYHGGEKRIKLNVISSSEFYGLPKQTTKKENVKQKLEELKEKNTDVYQMMINNITPEDFMNFGVVDKNIGNRIYTIIRGNTILQNEEIGIEEILRNAVPDKIYEESDTRKEIENALFEYSEFINLDEIILVALANQLNKLQSSKRDIEEMNKVKKFATVLEKYMEKRDSAIYGDMDKKIDFGYIKEIMKTYINGIFYGKKEIRSRITESLITGTSNLDDYSDREVRYLLGLYPKGIFTNHDNEELVIKLFSRGFLSYQEIQDIKEKDFSDEMLIALYKSKKLTKQEVIDRYLDNKLELESIRNLRESLEDKSQLNDLVSVEGLVDAFKNRNTDPEKYEKLKELMYELRIRKNTEQEKKELGEEIIEQDEELLENHNLIELYKDRLITIDNAVDWGGQDIAITLLKNGEISYKDARRLYEDDMLDINTFKDVLKDSNITLVKKLSLVNGTFSRENDESIRQELVKIIEIENARRNGQQTRKKISNSTQNIQTGRSKVRVTDPAKRWELYRVIDPDYREDVTNDGYLIKDMPNVLTVAIEPLYKSNSNITQYASNAASFFLDRDIYLREKANIITPSNKIDVGYLNQLSSSNKDVVKITHTTRGTNKTWAKKVSRYFLDYRQIQRTSEELEKIEQAVKTVDESCREI